MEFRNFSIIVDLDGTLCDNSHRVHLAQAKDWDAFHAGIPLDVPHTEVATILAILAKEAFEIILLTGRDEKYREDTLAWLRRHDLVNLFDHLLMRPDDDRRPDHELKPSMITEHFGSAEEAQHSVLFCLEDRDKVVEALRNYGLTVWQVKEGAY